MGMVGNKIAYKAFENYLKVFVPLVAHLSGPVPGLQDALLEHRRRGPVHPGGIVAAAAVAFKAGAVLPGAADPGAHVPGGYGGRAGCTAPFAAVLKVKFGTNETLLTLMLNYVALYFAHIPGGDPRRRGTSFWTPRPPGLSLPTSARMVSFPSIPIGKFTLNVCVLLTIAHRGAGLLST